MTKGEGYKGLPAESFYSVMRVHPLIRITRPVNALMAGVAALLGYLIGTGGITFEALILLPIVTLITAGGNVLNDVVDAEIDAINRPRRPIPSGAISRRASAWYAVNLFLAGIFLSIFTTPLCFLIALFNSTLLILYAWHLKREPLVGNLTVSYLTGSVFLFGGALAGLYGLERNLPLALITILATMARELLKAAEDVKGDTAGGVVSVPILIGIQRTSFLAFGFAGLAVVVSLLPVIPWWGLTYLLQIGIVDLMILAGTGMVLSCQESECVRKSKATTILKVGMYLALLVFCGAAVV